MAAYRSAAASSNGSEDEISNYPKWVSTAWALPESTYRLCFQHQVKARSTVHGIPQKILYCATVAVLASGCASEVGEDEDANDPVLSAIEALGFDSASAVIAENRILVEGDILLYRDKLMKGEYSPAFPTTGDRLVDKGYLVGTGAVAANKVNDMQLVFDAEFGNQGFAGSFVYDGALEWQDVPESDIVYSESGTNVITVHALLEPAWQSLNPCADLRVDVAGCAEYPSSGNPGRNLYWRVEQGTLPTKGGCSTWELNSLKVFAMHEFGHTLGFAHPADSAFGGSTHIGGTAACTDPMLANCPANPGYDTVMNAVLPAGPCDAPPYWTLRQDDIDSAQAQY